MALTIPRHYPAWVSDEDRDAIERRIAGLEGEPLNVPSRASGVSWTIALLHIAGVAASAWRGEHVGAVLVSIDALVWTLIALTASLGIRVLGSTSYTRIRAQSLLVRALRSGGVVRPEHDYPIDTWDKSRSLAAALGLERRGEYYVDPARAEPAISAARERLNREIATEFWLSPERVAHLRSYAPMAYVIDDLVDAGRLEWTDDGLTPVGSGYRH